MSSRKCLDDVNKTIVKFLSKNGGLSNGYNTFVEGKVETNYFHSLTWNTPAMNDLTIKTVKDLGWNLNKDIIKILKKYKIDKLIIKTSERGESGCIDTIIEIPFTRKVYW